MASDLTEHQILQHGHLGDPQWKDPVLVTKCDQTARPGYGSVEAHEYMEVPETLALKVKLLVSLLSKSRKACVYTGAGISTAAGISDYATQSEKTQAPTNSSAPPETPAAVHFSPKSPMLARPTLSHRVLAGMFARGLLKRWVQQNHDGLPQKAGVPQHLINEIHGALYDPSNPVIPMSGTLRTDLFEDLLSWTQHTDLCLVLGTSLSGMNADRLCTDVAERLQARGWAPERAEPAVFGAVIVGLQRTGCDHLASLRIYAKLDDVFALVAQELGISVEDREYALPEIPAAQNPEPFVFMVPYDAAGRLQEGGPLLRWDLREDTRVRLTAGQFVGDEGEVVGPNQEGHIKIRFFHPIGKGSFKAPMERTLGLWWISAAVFGQVPLLPIISIV